MSNLSPYVFIKNIKFIKFIGHKKKSPTCTIIYRLLLLVKIMLVPGNSWNMILTYRAFQMQENTFIWVGSAKTGVANVHKNMLDTKKNVHHTSFLVCLSTSSACLCIHTHRQRCPIWISSHCFEVSSLDILHFAYFWCQSLRFTEHNDGTPLKWILNLPLFCELHGVFGCRQPVADSKHSGFIHCDPFVKIWN